MVTDQDNWQQEDYWATPLETLSRRQGDCEDYSISKYITLVLAGMPEDKLRITVKARITENGIARSQAHGTGVLPGASKRTANSGQHRSRHCSWILGPHPRIWFNKGHYRRARHQTLERPTNRLSRWGGTQK